MIKKNLLLLVFLSQFILSYAQELRLQAKEDGGNWAYYNLKGENISTAYYKQCYAFEGDYAIVFDESAKKMGFIDRDGKVAFPQDEKFELMKAGGFGANVINGFKSGLAPAIYKGQIGYLGTDGTVKIPTKYKLFTPFNSGYALVGNKAGNYVIDSTGKEKMIITKLVSFNHFQEGLAPVKVKEGTWGFLNTKGKLVIEAKFDRVGYFVNGLAWARNQNDLIGFINKKGEWVIDPQFTKVLSADPESGMAKVYLESYFWINTLDQAEGNLKVNDTDLYKSFSEGLCAGRKGDKIGFFDKNGRWVIQPAYKSVRSFVNGYASVKEGELWGVIDAKGNWVIKPKFVSIKDFK